MSPTQAFCGLDCGECEARLASQNNDLAALAEVAQLWNARYNRGDLTPEMCICDGCSSGKRVSTAHAVNCEIRLCASARGVASCAHCPDYGCEKLRQLFAFAPVLEERLEAIRHELGL